MRFLQSKKIKNINEAVKTQIQLLNQKGEVQDNLRIPQEWNSNWEISPSVKEGYYQNRDLQAIEYVNGVFGGGKGSYGDVTAPSEYGILLGANFRLFKELSSKETYPLNEKNGKIILKGESYSLTSKKMILDEEENWQFLLEGETLLKSSLDGEILSFKLENRNDDGFLEIKIDDEYYIITEGFIENGGKRKYWREVGVLEKDLLKDSLFTTSLKELKSLASNDTVFKEVTTNWINEGEVIEDYASGVTRSSHYNTGVKISPLSFKAPSPQSNKKTLYGKRIYRFDVNQSLEDPVLYFTVGEHKKSLNTRKGKTYFVEFPEDNSLPISLDYFQLKNKEMIDINKPLNATLKNTYGESEGIDKERWLSYELISTAEIKNKVLKQSPSAQKEEFEVLIQKGESNSYIVGINIEEFQEDKKQRGMFIGIRRGLSLEIIDYFPLLKGGNTYTTFFDEERLREKELIIGTTKGELVRYHSYKALETGEVNKNLHQPFESFIIESEVESVDFEIINSDTGEVFAVGNTGKEKKKEVAPLERGHTYAVSWSKEGFRSEEKTISGSRGRLLLKLTESPPCEKFTVSINTESARVDIYSAKTEEHLHGGTALGKQIIFPKLKVDGEYLIIVEKFGYKQYKKEFIAKEYECSIQVNLIEDPHCEFLKVTSNVDGALVKILDEFDVLLERGVIRDGAFIGEPLINGKLYKLSISKEGYFTEEIEKIGAFGECVVEVLLTEDPNYIPSGEEQLVTEKQLYEGLDENLEMAKRYTNTKLKEYDEYKGFGFAGTYSDYVQYNKNNIVEYKGSSYVLKDDTNAGSPEEDVAWSLFTRGVDLTEWYTPVGSINGLFPDEEGNIEIGEILTLEDLDEVRMAVERDTKAYTDHRIEEIINLGGENPSYGDYMSISGGEFIGEVYSSPEVDSVHTGRFRNIFIDNEHPNEEIGSNGDIFFIYDEEEESEE